MGESKESQLSHGEGQGLGGGDLAFLFVRDPGAIPTLKFE